MNIADILHEQATAQPERPAIVEMRGGRERVTTYAELERQAQHLAGLLGGLGLSPGDRVLVFVPMSAELYIILAALFRAGLVAVFLDPSAGKAHLKHGCGVAGPKAFIGIPKAQLLRVTSGALRRIGNAISTGGWMPGTLPWRSIFAAKAAGGIAPAEADTPALMTFTSGSTGLPKCAVRTHGFLIAQHAALASSIHLAPGDIDLGTLPIFTLANLASGLTTIIPNVDLRSPGLIVPNPIITQITRHAITRSTASPAFFERLADYCLWHKIQLPTLRQLYTGGAPVFPRLLEKLHCVAPNAAIVAVYGSTEAEPIAQLDFRDISPEDIEAMHEGKGLLAGKPEPCIRLAIVGNQWGHPLAPTTAAGLAAISQPPNTPGEIVVTGAHVLPGYLDGAGDAQNKFRVDSDIYHRTGDAGFLDDQGRLWLLGRCEAAIPRRAGILYPLAVETAVLQHHCTVRRVALVACDSQPVLALEIDSFAPADILDQVRRQSGIEDVRLVPRIPLDKRHNAKVDYPALRRAMGRG